MNSGSIPPNSSGQDSGLKNSTLIIGGAGFLGNSLAKWLSASGQSVIVADTQRRLTLYALQLQNVEYVACEWPNCNFDTLLNEVKNVVHMAWSSNPASSMLDIESDASENILGTVRLLESLCNIEKFIFMSSGGTVYGNTDDIPVTELSNTNPVSAYGISKLCCEKYVQMYSLRRGYTHINLRLGNPYGAYQLNGTPVGVIANFVRKVLNDEAIVLYGTGDTVRDYLYIDDFLRAMSLLLQSPCASGIYNLGSGVGTSLVEIIDAIEQKLNKKISINRHKERRLDVRNIVLDVSKLENEINCGSAMSVTEGIGMMIEQHSMSETKSAVI